MITKLKYRSVRQARSYMAALLALALLLPTFASIGLFPERASAADYNGEFIDAVTISVEGKGTFVDDNPWGDGLGKGVNFQSTVAPNCNSEISGYDDGGKLKGDSDTLTLDITIRKANSFGQCIDEDSGTIELKSARKGTITAYRYDNGTPDNRDDDTIFMPAYRIFTDNVPSTVVSGLNGVFRKVPNDTVIKEGSCDVKTDCYIQHDGGRADNIDGLGSVEWLETVPPVQHYKYCTDAGAAGYIDPCDDRTVDITLANGGDPLSEIPSVYSGVDLSGAGGENGAEEAGAGGAADDGQGTCEASGFSLAWILCPVFNGLAEATDWIYRTLIEPFLYTPPVSTDPSSASFRVWSSFRVIGNIILVIGMLVIVFGQSLGGGLIDAYTAKKVLPRIIAAAIMINLSVYFVAIAVDISNVVGTGIQQLMFAPFKASGMANFELSGTQIAVGTAPLAVLGGMIGGAAALGGGGAVVTALATIGTSIFPLIGLFIILPAVLALIAVFVTLILRRALILFLVMVSPIAFALYCLPNTEKYFKKWWEYLFKALLVYPLVAALFALADILAITLLAANSAGSSNAVENGLAIVIAFVIQLIPLFIIPFSFKIAGGILGNLYGTLSGFNKKTTEAVKGQPNDPNSLRNRTKRGAMEGLTRAQGQLIYPGRGDPSKTNRRKRALSRAAGSAIFGNFDSRMSMYNRMAAERAEQLSSTGDDFMIYAAGGYQENGKYYNSKGQEISKGDYKRGKALYGSSQHDLGQALNYRLKKVQTDEDAAQFRKAFDMNARQNNWTQAEIDGVWASATYPHKGTFSSEWYSKPKLQDDGTVGYEDISNNAGNYKSYIGDLHKTRQSFQLGQLRDGDWRAMLDQQQKLEKKLAEDMYGDYTDVDTKRLVTADEQRQQDATILAQTYEVFDAASQKLQRVPGEDGESTGEIAASSVSAAAAPVIQSAVANRGIVDGAQTFKFGGPGADGSRTLTHTPSGAAVSVNTTGDIGRSAIPKL